MVISFPFLPAANHRNDGYGGDLPGRMRFALEVTEVVRATWPDDRPLLFRVSAVDGKGGRWELDDTIELARALKQRGVDLVDCSSGGIYGDTDRQWCRVRRVPGHICARVKHGADIPTIAVGGITDAHQAESILRAGDADLVALAREFLWHADWAAHSQGAWRRGCIRADATRYAYRLRQRETQRPWPSTNQAKSREPRLRVGNAPDW